MLRCPAPNVYPQKTPDLLMCMNTDSAGCFDRLAANPRWRTFDAEERRKVDAFVRRWGIKPGDRVLEPGCGAGRLTEVLSALTGPAGCVLAFDASPEFMRIAAQRALPPHVTLHTARADALPFAPDSFDHVVCFNVFPHLTPLLQTTRLLVAALRPGGVFWIAHTRSQAFVNAVHREGPAGFHEHVLPAPGELGQLLSDAGLGGIEIEDGADCFLARAVRLAPAVASGHPGGHA
jgi:demethylmenaquinone methyltransferase/2-methoxy-6-polyprenyl-1,4-benzoquinol methylase